MYVINNEQIVESVDASSVELSQAHYTEERECLAFHLGDKEYAIDFQYLQEVRDYEPVVPLPNAPESVKGILNLRGTSVPMIDMRIKFKLGAPTYNACTIVLILNVGGNIVGIVVDGVSDVVMLGAEQIQPSPDKEAGNIDANYLIGLGTLTERTLLLVDIEKLISEMDIAQVGGLTV
jgi:purine-binding chemotaxis protein CheW